MQTAALLSPVSQPVNMLSALREGTRDLHERIESRMDLATRVASIDGYRSLLGRYYGLYAPLEDEFASSDYAAAWTTLGIDAAQRRKLDLLESDLRFLGLTTLDLIKLERHTSDFISPDKSAAEVAGCAYVIEGATLGGQIIGRYLEQTLGLHPGEPGACFFYCYGPRTGVMWQQFKRGVEDFWVREEASCEGRGTKIVKQAVAASRRTFAGMEAWLCL